MSPALEAHLRLMARLPVRTHERPVEDDRRGENMARAHWNARGRGGMNAEAVMIEGKVYRSQREAKEKLGVGNKKMEMWIDTGYAVRVKA